MPEPYESYLSATEASRVSPALKGVHPAEVAIVLEDLSNRHLLHLSIQWIATTHFEPTGARLAFPCWDEPMYKAVYDISIKHLSNYTTVISNMPVLNRTYHADNTITTYFERSMPMSTYLVAFIVSDYDYKKHDEDRIKIYTKPDSIHKTDLAYNFSLEAMKVLDEYTEIPYFKINPKMDQVTVRDFNPSAMENWGICTYREDFLLYEEGVSTSIDKEIVITTISHEFSHQWFGNLVSPTWWKFIWLNEGFANYFQYFITDKVRPTWRFMDLFPVEAMQAGAFLLDGKDSRPMNQNASHPKEIVALFDAISYQKAGCIIRMLSHIVTEEVFHTAMKNYLRENSYSVADSDNLIRYLQNAAGKDKLWGGVPLTKIVESWITQSGYPMVTVKNTGPGHFTLSQKQFLYYDTDIQKMWWVPITYTTNLKLNFNDTSVTHWISPKVGNPTISEPKADWIILNKQQTGYYRVNYDDGIWQSLAKYLNSGKMHHIHPVNRAQLIDDALTMARINHTKYETAMSLTLYLHREMDYIPWMTTFKNLEFLRPLIFTSKNYDIFKHYIRYIMQSLTKNVTYVSSPKDDHPTKVLKMNAMKWACLADVKECVDEAHKEFNEWLKNPKHRLDPDLESAILCTGLSTASEEVWDDVLYRLSEGTFEGEGGTSPLEVLGCSNNHTILQKFLIYSARTDANIRFETAAIAVVENTNVTGAEIVQYVLDYEMANIGNMHDFDDQLENVARTVSTVITNNEDFLKLSRTAVTHRASDSVVQTVVQNSLRNMKWIAKYGRTIDDWLLDHEMLFKSSSTEKTLMSLLLILSIFNTILFL
ncbi:aminopeptidase N-like [Lasioglossum baleicum]|uniref:aminopeptidase N-like n=1 Tax=Lasioglossum baleicum TaxID=434251 RepID=UPI003FCE200C